MNLSLKTPCDVFEANAGFKREVTVNNSQVSSDTQTAVTCPNSFVYKMT